MRNLIISRVLGIGSVMCLSAVFGLAQPGPGGPMHGGMGFGGRGGGPMEMWAGGPGSRTPVTGAPYSAVRTLQFQQTLAGGNVITRTEQETVYRDSQGRVRTERTVTPPNGAAGQAAVTFVQIHDPVAGVEYFLNPAKQTVMKHTLPAANSTGRGAGHTMSADSEGSEGPRGRGVNSHQVAREELGAQSINGLPSTGSRITTTVPAGAIGNAQVIQSVREVWISSDLKVPVQIKSSDPRFGNSTMQLTNINRAEPDPSLFQVPAGYTVSERPSGRASQ